jgi:hypothetical protein
MKKTAIAALAAVLLAGPAAGEPAPAPAPAIPRAEGTAKPAEKGPDAKKGSGAVAPKPTPKADAAAKKDPPCEPVKPCPIE